MEKILEKETLRLRSERCRTLGRWKPEGGGWGAQRESHEPQGPVLAGGHAGCILASGDMGTGRLHLEFNCQSLVSSLGYMCTATRTALFPVTLNPHDSADEGPKASRGVGSLSKSLSWSGHRWAWNPRTSTQRARRLLTKNVTSSPYSAAPRTPGPPRQCCRGPTPADLECGPQGFPEPVAVTPAV